jgi:cysteine sulfinate desulfinase/cysteine desulfurase-like protein
MRAGNAAAAEAVMARLIDLARTIPGVMLIPADRDPRDSRFSPSILKLAVPALPSEVTVRLLGDRGICVSPGSACATGSRKRLRVLEAMRVPAGQAAGAVRVSIGPTTTADEIDAFTASLEAAVRDVTDRITAAPAREVART